MADSLAAVSLSNQRASASPPPAAATTISGAGYALLASVLNFTKKFLTVSVFGVNFWFSNFDSNFSQVILRESVP